LNDYAPITQVTSAPNVLVVHPIAAREDREGARGARQGEAAADSTIASSGNGSTQHLTGALFGKMAGIEMTHIPYRGSGQVTADLLGGQVMVAFPRDRGHAAHIKSGKLRALGVTSATRSPELPEVPTIAEAGVKGYEMVAWFGVAAPKGLQREVQVKLHGDLLRVLRNPDFQKSLAAVGQEPAWQDTPERFYEFLKVESVKWAKVVADSGATVQ
jgi:tripartite-type tricarboxylate transporter receptor subunit TctC